MIHEIDNKNEWLLLSVTFTAKLELVFVLTLENAFSYGFILKLTKRDFKIALRLRDRRVFI